MQIADFNLETDNSFLEKHRYFLLIGTPFHIIGLIIILLSMWYKLMATSACKDRN